MSLPLVSVVIPNYNDSHYIGQTIETVLNQTYSNIELIVVNDGSTDNSAKIIRSYEKKDSRLKFINRRTNKGTNYTVNEGIQNTTGKYFIGISANDYILPTFIESCVTQLVEHPDVTVALTDIQFLNTLNSQIRNYRFIPNASESIKILPNKLPYFYHRSFLKMHGMNTLVATELVKKNGGFQNAVASLADWYLITNIAFTGGVVYIPKSLIVCREIPNSYSLRMAKDKKMRKEMYHSLLNDIEKTDRNVFNLYRKTGELGYVLRFSPTELLKRPKFWSFLPNIILRFIKRKYLVVKFNRKEAVAN